MPLADAKFAPWVCRRTRTKAMRVRTLHRGYERISRISDRLRYGAKAASRRKAATFSLRPTWALLSASRRT